MSGRPLWPRRVVAVAATVVVTIAGCATPPDAEPIASTSPPTPAPTQPVPDLVSPVVSSIPASSETIDGVEVAVIGDSLTVSAHDQIVDAFANADANVVGFDALDGRRMVNGTANRPGGLAALQAAVADSSITPDVWVIALGTNDVAAQISPEQLATDIAALLGEVDAPVVWIDVFVGAFTERSADFARQIRGIAAQRSDVVVGDWYHEALDPDMLVDDQVHLTDAGKDRFAAVMVDTVRRVDLRS